MGKACDDRYLEEIFDKHELKIFENIAMKFNGSRKLELEDITQISMLIALNLRDNYVKVVAKGKATDKKKFIQRSEIKKLKTKPIDPTDPDYHAFLYRALENKLRDELRTTMTVSSRFANDDMLQLDSYTAGLCIPDAAADISYLEVEVDEVIEKLVYEVAALPGSESILPFLQDLLAQENLGEFILTDIVEETHSQRLHEKGPNAHNKTIPLTTLRKAHGLSSRQSYKLLNFVKQFLIEHGYGVPNNEEEATEGQSVSGWPGVYRTGGTRATSIIELP